MIIYALRDIEHVFFTFSEISFPRKHLRVFVRFDGMLFEGACYEIGKGA